MKVNKICTYKNRTVIIIQFSEKRQRVEISDDLNTKKNPFWVDYTDLSNMGNMVEELKKYFEETPEEKVLEDWEKYKEYDNIGVTVDEFLKQTDKIMEIKKKRKRIERPRIGNIVLGGDMMKVEAEETKRKIIAFKENFKRKQISDGALKEIVNDLISEEAREEAMTILRKSSDSQLMEFMFYHRERKETVCCMVLDSIKIDLVKQGVMKMGEDDWFGKPMWDDNNEKKEKEKES